MPATGTGLHLRTAIPKALAHELVRQPALERLSVVGVRCVALVAASGYGKTTLLAQYARNTIRQVAWLTLSESDVETRQLMLSLSQAVQERTQVRVAAAQSSLDSFLQELLAQLAAEERGVDLILDRAERITPIHGTRLANLVDYLPEGHRLILAGYDLLGFPLARLVAAGHAEVMTQQHLRFSSLETQQFLAGHSVQEQAQSIQDAMEGWPVGIVLSTLDTARHLDVNDLLRDVIGTLPAPIQQALPELSLLEEWSEAAGDELGVTLPPGWLNLVRSVGLPLTPLGKGVFRPHSLLLSLLGRQLQLRSERARMLHARCAELAHDAGNLSSAMRHAAMAQRLDLLEACAAKLFPNLRAQHEFPLLAELSALHPGEPPVWWQENAIIAQLELGQVQEGSARLEALLRADKLGALGYTALSLQAARHGEFEAQLEYAQRGLSASDAPLHPSLSMLEASALISLEQLEAGVQVTQRMVTEARQRGASLEEANALNFHQYALQMLQRWDEQAAALERASALFAQQNRPASALQIDTLRIGIYLLHGRVAEAQSLLTHSIRLAERNQPVHLASLYLSQAHLALWHADTEQAAQHLQAAETLITRNNLTVLLPFLHFQNFDLCCVLQRPELAQQAYQAGRLTATLPLYQKHLLPLFDGLYAFDQGDHDAARVALNRAAQFSGDQAHALRAQVLLLALDQRCGALKRSAVQQLAKDLAQVEVGWLCCADLQRLTPLIQAISGRFPQHPLTRLAHLAPPAPAQTLSVMVTQQITCFLRGTPLKLPLAKSAELLVWLLWHESGSLHELLNDLWDGSRDPKHHEYFRVVVRRLRSLLRESMALDFDPLPYEQGRYRLHSALSVSLNLSEALTQARLGQYRNLLRLRATELLSDVPGEWAEGIRERIRREQLQALSTLEHRLADEAPSQTVALLQDVLRVQNDQEEFHLALIRTLLRVQPPEALRAYQAYCQMLARDFGSEPAPDLLRELRQLGLSL